MKASAIELLEEIAPDLQQFLRKGDLTPYTSQVDPNLNIENIDKLLKIHFLLYQNEGEVNVIDFVEKLPLRIRRIKTTIKQESTAIKGEVRGAIKWSETIKYRYSKNPSDKTTFICNEIEKNYDIPENLVLKSLLNIIHNIINDELDYAFKDNYCWLKRWFKSNVDLKETIEKIYGNNVYLKRISSNDIKITDRMLDRALKSRIPLYKEAAALHIQYNKLIQYQLDEIEAKKLLTNTFIKPDRLEELFELYWTIKIVKQFNDPVFQLIEPGNNMVAQWSDNGDSYKIYHNSTGSAGILDFKEDLDPIIEQYKDEDNFVGRNLRVILELRKMLQEKNQWINKRPDIVLERYDNKGIIKSILICEVKYTEDRNYAIVGLRQLLEYIALAKKNNTYIEKPEALFEKLESIKGCLFLDKVENFNVTHENLLIIKYGEEHEKIKLFLK